MKIQRIVLNTVMICFIASMQPINAAARPLIKRLSALSKLGYTRIAKPSIAIIRRNPIKAVAGAGIGSWMTHQNIKAQEKECFYIEDVNDLMQGKAIPTIDIVLAQRSASPVHLQHSQTYQAVYALLGEKPPQNIRAYPEIKSF